MGYRTGRLKHTPRTTSNPSPATVEDAREIAGSIIAAWAAGTLRKTEASNDRVIELRADNEDDAMSRDRAEYG